MMELIQADETCTCTAALFLNAGNLNGEARRAGADCSHSTLPRARVLSTFISAPPIETCDVLT